MIASAFATLSSIAALNVAVTQVIKDTLKLENKTLIQIVSWIVPILISVFGFVFGLGVFGTFGTITSVSGWLYAVITGIGLGLSSNGLYCLEKVKDLIEIGEEICTFRINK